MTGRIRNNRKTRRGVALIVADLCDKWPEGHSLDEYQEMRQAFGWLVQNSYKELLELGFDPALFLGDMVEEG
jgi:hypothetical protein